MAWSEPTNPVGTYDPCWMMTDWVTWQDGWNTAIQGRPTAAGANVLSNCVGYCQGRMLKLYLLGNPTYDPSVTKTHPYVLYAWQAGEWYTQAEALGCTMLTEPEPCSILCTSTHVAVVEKYENGQWWISESGYDTMPHYLYQNSIYKSGGRWYSSWSTDPNIIGFFRIPGVTPGPAPGRRKYDRRRHSRYRYMYM